MYSIFILVKQRIVNPLVLGKMAIPRNANATVTNKNKFPQQPKLLLPPKNSAVDIKPAISQPGISSVNQNIVVASTLPKTQAPQSATPQSIVLATPTQNIVIATSSQLSGAVSTANHQALVPVPVQAVIPPKPQQRPQNPRITQAVLPTGQPLPKVITLVKTPSHNIISVSRISSSNVIFLCGMIEQFHNNCDTWTLLLA